MVQFRVDAYRVCNYWKLNHGLSLPEHYLREQLEEKGYSVLKSTNTNRLKELYVRSQRGLLSYEGLLLRDLKLYAAQRVLALNQKTTVAALKAQLEQADDEGTFNRLLDLAPEVRRIIYTHYFKSFEYSNSTYYHDTQMYKCQPPITFASRHIRQEALPLFYECCEIPIFATRGSASFYEDFTALLHPSSAAFIRSTPDQSFRRIRLLCCELRDLGISLRLDLNNKKDPIDVVPSSARNLQFGVDRVKREQKDRLISDLRAIAVEVATREGPLKLMKADLEHMYDTARRIVAAL